MKKLPGKFPDSERIYLNHGVRPLERAHQAAYGVHARMLDIALCKAFELGLHVVDYRLKAVFFDEHLIHADLRRHGRVIKQRAERILADDVHFVIKMRYQPARFVQLLVFFYLLDNAAERGDRKSTRLNSSHRLESRMPSSA